MHSETVDHWLTPPHHQVCPHSRAFPGSLWSPTTVSAGCLGVSGEALSRKIGSLTGKWGTMKASQKHPAGSFIQNAYKGNQHGLSAYPSAQSLQLQPIGWWYWLCCLYPEATLPIPYARLWPTPHAGDESGKGKMDADVAYSSRAGVEGKVCSRCWYPSDTWERQRGKLPGRHWFAYELNSSVEGAFPCYLPRKSHQSLWARRLSV